MKNWIKYCQEALNRRFLVPLAAVAMFLSLTAYEFAKPVSAAPAAPAAAAAPLDDNSVSALLSLDRAMEALAARVTPATVNVTVTAKRSGDRANAADSEDNNSDSNGLQRFFGPFGKQFDPRFGFGQPMGPQPQIEHGVGSGVIISPDGYIVTNNHVVDGATEIRVTMNDRRVLPAKLIGTDPLTDLAVIKVSATDLPNVAWGGSTQLRAGQTLLAFGTPSGLRFTVTRGMVSALNRPNPDMSDRHKPGEFIQTDAAINPGNSGGALVNARGELIGINTFLISSSGSFSGMGFAIPAQIVQPTVETLIRDGKITHAYIGIQIADVTPDNAKFFQMNKAEGALISQVEPDAPGAKAGLHTGDVITELDGKPVTDAGQLQMTVGQKRPGDTIHLQVMRDSKVTNVAVKLEALGGGRGTETAGGEHGKGRWGLSLGDLSPGG